MRALGACNGRPDFGRVRFNAQGGGHEAPVHCARHRPRRRSRCSAHRRGATRGEGYPHWNSIRRSARLPRGAGSSRSAPGCRAGGGWGAVFDIRYTEGRTERFSAFAAELVNLRVDILIAASTPGAMAAKKATSTIPVVMVAVSDPVGSQLVASLARPGGNITGLSLLAPALSAKRLDLLTQALPPVSRVAVLWNVSNEGMMLLFR